MPVKRVWIVEGCISCNLCEDLCPEVFEVPAGGESRLTADHARHLRGDPGTDGRIRDAQEGCPVEVIRVEGSEA